MLESQSFMKPNDGYPDIIIPAWEANSPYSRLTEGGKDHPRLCPQELRDFETCEGAFWQGLIVPMKEGGIDTNGLDYAATMPLNVAGQRFDHENTGRYSHLTHLNLACIINDNLRLASVGLMPSGTHAPASLEELLSDCMIFAEWRMDILGSLEYELEFFSDSMMHLAQDLNQYTRAFRNRVAKWRVHEAEHASH